MSWPYQVTIQAIYPVWGQSATFIFATSILISHGVSKDRLHPQLLNPIFTVPVAIEGEGVPYWGFTSSRSKFLCYHAVSMSSRGFWRWWASRFRQLKLAKHCHEDKTHCKNRQLAENPWSHRHWKSLPEFPGDVSICRIIDSDSIKPIWSESIDPSLPSATSTSQSRGRSALISSPNAAPEEAQINLWIWINGRSWRRLNHECWFKNSECCSCGLML